MFGKVHVKKHEVGLHFRRGDFHRLLEPGTHHVWGLLFRPGQHAIEKRSILETLFQHPLLDVLVKEPGLAESLLVVDLKDRERALVWRDGRLAYILGPGRHALWKKPFDLKVEAFDADRFRFEHPRLEAVLAHKDAGKWLEQMTVEAHQEILVFREGVLVDRLDQGKYVFWKGAGRFAFKTADRREQVLNIAGQEIMTGDKVTLRVNLLVAYQVADPVKAVSVVADAGQALYREAQLVLRAAIGTRTLDAILGEKESVGSEVREALARRAQEFGVAVRSVGIRDVILPGDMKEILNQVIAAEKLAQANLIRRREETAAARNQANTAKLLAENPALARMRELELLQEILAGAKATFVFGEGDILQRLRGLVAADANAGGPKPESGSG